MSKWRTNGDVSSYGDRNSIVDKTAPAPSCVTYDILVGEADDSLMRHMQGGNHDALAVLFDRYHRLVMNVALRILRDIGEAEELMQSVFLEILRSAARFDPRKGTTKVWILQYAYHRSFNRREYLVLRGFYGDDYDFPPMRIENYGAHSLDSLESARTVQQALAQLKKMQRKTLELAFYEGLTMHEIAETTGETFDSVRHHYYRGLEKLRLLLCETVRKRASSSVEGVTHVRP